MDGLFVSSKGTHGLVYHTSQTNGVSSHFEWPAYLFLYPQSPWTPPPQSNIILHRKQITLVVLGTSLIIIHELTTHETPLHPVKSLTRLLKCGHSKISAFPIIHLSKRLAPISCNQFYVCEA